MFDFSAVYQTILAAIVEAVQGPIIELITSLLGGLVG